MEANAAEANAAEANTATTLAPAANRRVPRECTLHAMTRTHNMLVNAPVAVRCVV
jgi:hypothetical protein